MEIPKYDVKIIVSNFNTQIGCDLEIVTKYNYLRIEITNTGKQVRKMQVRINVMICLNFTACNKVKEYFKKMRK